MNGKNELATLTRQQESPGLAKPEDFEIVRDGDAVFTGQRSDRIQRASDAECGRGKFAGTPDRPNVNTAGKPKTRGIDGPEGV